MTTFNDLIEEILGDLQGYTLTPDLVTSLAADMTASETTCTIDMPEGGIPTGVIEIGDEQIFVKTVDENSQTLTLLPQGRGWRGTTATTHGSGDTVVISPLIPRIRVKRAINDTIQALWPLVFGVGTTEFTYTSGPTLAWEIPAEAEVLLDVRYQDRHDNWVKVRRFEMVYKTNTTSFPTGNSLRIADYPPSGCKIQVVYGKRPALLSGSADTLATAGLSETAKDAVKYGALGRLVPALDAGRLAVQYVPADELDQPRQVGSAMALAREFQKSYDAALQREAGNLQRLYPGRIHFTSAR